MIDEDELLGGSDWLAPAPDPRPAKQRSHRLRLAACAFVLVAIAAGLLAVARTPHPASRQLPPAAPPLTRPVLAEVKPARALQRAPRRAHVADRRRPVVHVAVIAVGPSAVTPPQPPPPSPAQEFGFER